MDIKEKDACTTWSDHHALKDEQLSNNFSGLGEADTICCFTCGVLMKDWQPNEDIWVRHARMSPFCKFVKNLKGADYIQQVLSKNGEYSPPEPQIVIPRKVRIE